MVPAHSYTCIYVISEFCIPSMHLAIVIYPVTAVMNSCMAYAVVVVVVVCQNYPVIGSGLQVNLVKTNNGCSVRVC